MSALQKDAFGQLLAPNTNHSFPFHENLNFSQVLAENINAQVL
jgi:hypothetical protein